MIRKFFLAASGLSAAMLAAAPAHADITGKIDATINLTTVCTINGTVTNDGASGQDFGNLNFGSQTTLFTQADAQVANNAGGTFTVQCSNGIAPVITFQAGENDTEGAGTGLRAMESLTTVGHFVTYDLYSDGARSLVIPIGGSINLVGDGTLQTVNVYGRAFGEAGLVTGAYADVVTVLIDL